MIKHLRLGKKHHHEVVRGRCVWRGACVCVCVVCVVCVVRMHQLIAINWQLIGEHDQTIKLQFFKIDQLF